MPELTERFWEDLLLWIEDGRVIPVIGPELVTVDDGGTQVPLYSWLARRLAEEIGMPLADLPDPFDLNDVVVKSLRSHNDQRDEIYSTLRRILSRVPSDPSPALTALAGIQGFKLFVSLTFDSQLAKALSQVHHGATPRSVVYTTNEVGDLPVPYEEIQEPLIFQLLGKASSVPEYAICENDLLEFLHALQDKQRQPAKLFDALRTNHLLLLGCGFSDWLARFFLRTARGVELSQDRKRLDIIADGRSEKEPSLAMFLSTFSSDSRVLDMAAVAFTEKLAELWQAKHPEIPELNVSIPESHNRVAGPGNGDVFLSYASEDRAIVEKIAEGLRQYRLSVWFDKNELEAGDAWANCIEHGIDKCALFLPVISRESLAEQNQRRYFWREWNKAIKLAEGMAPGEEFIVPVVVDQIRLDQSELPEAISSKQGINLPGGAVTPEFGLRLEQIVRKYWRRRQGRSSA
jgi:hypothetical protein